MTVASCTYQGSYTQITDVYAAVIAWMEANGYEPAEPMFNIYHVSPHETQNPDEFVTEICYPVKDIMIDIQKAHKEFQQYLSGFDTDNEKIRLKLIHTNEVVRCAGEITKRMNLSEEDKRLAEIIALLHDIGRFEQVRQYDSFEPATMDHAGYGVKLLFEDNPYTGERTPWIRNFVGSDRWDNIIRESIGRHSAYSVGEIKDQRTLFHARLIRDADKLDNCRVKLEDSMQVLLSADEETVGAQKITDTVWESCLSYHSIRSGDRMTKMDYWVSYIA